MGFGGGDCCDKPQERQKRLEEIKNVLLKHDGVYWGRACNGNNDGKSPTDDPAGCFHSFGMIVGDNDVTIFQSMIYAWTMGSKYGIKTYTEKEFPEQLLQATTQIR